MIINMGQHYSLIATIPEIVSFINESQNTQDEHIPTIPEIVSFINESQIHKMDILR